MFYIFLATSKLIFVFHILFSMPVGWFALFIFLFCFFKDWNLYCGLIFHITTSYKDIQTQRLLLHDVFLYSIRILYENGLKHQHPLKLKQNLFETYVETYEVVVRDFRAF